MFVHTRVVWSFGVGCGCGLWCNNNKCNTHMLHSTRRRETSGEFGCAIYPIVLLVTPPQRQPLSNAYLKCKRCAAYNKENNKNNNSEEKKKKKEEGATNLQDRCINNNRSRKQTNFAFDKLARKYGATTTSVASPLTPFTPYPIARLNASR